MLSACADRDGGGDRERELSDLRAEVADVRAEQRALREELRSLRGAATDGDAETPAQRDAGVAPDAAPPAKTVAKRPQPLPPATGGKPLEQATVNIEIDSNPAGASVFLGDKRMGATPLIVKAPAGNEVDLDRVLVALWRDFGAVGRGYPEDVRGIFEEATGLDLGDFFARFIRGREDPDLAGALAGVGLELNASWEGFKAEEGARPPVWLGVVLSTGGRVIAMVPEGGPAERAGVSPMDELIAINRYQVLGEGDVRARLAGRSPGERASLSLFRRGRLEHLEVALEAAPPTRFEITASQAAGVLEKKLYRAWLGQPHPGTGVLASATVPTPL